MVLTLKETEAGWVREKRDGEEGGGKGKKWKRAACLISSTLGERPYDFKFHVFLRTA